MSDVRAGAGPIVRAKVDLDDHALDATGHRTRLAARTATGDRVEIEFHHPPGTFAPTRATLVGVAAITAHGEKLLSGHGLDWGCGVGCLAITAVQVADVAVTGLDLLPANVTAARRNAVRSPRRERLRFAAGDSFVPHEPSDRAALQERGPLDFVLANPPSSSPGDDGFGFRRRVLREALPRLTMGGVVFLNISSQYGRNRVQGLLKDAPGFRHGGVLASTDWTPFDLRRADLEEDLRSYAATEAGGAPRYEFGHPDDPSRQLTATEAVRLHSRTGRSPLTRWQSHLFVRDERGS